MVNWCYRIDILSRLCVVSYVGIRIDGSVGCRQSRDSGKAESLKDRIVADMGPDEAILRWLQNRMYLGIQYARLEFVLAP
jgi:hypothetical protein